MLLRRVLANLVENALQAIASDPAKAIPARVRLSVRVERASAAAAEGFVWLLVDDNGPGVAPSRHARVFDPYFTTKEHGTGLGLAIVRKILLDHGGDIVLDDAPSPLGGARFRVRLPLATESAAPPVDEVSSPA
jgi:signal transduction histidine kinase